MPTHTEILEPIKNATHGEKLQTNSVIARTPQFAFGLIPTVAGFRATETLDGGKKFHRTRKSEELRSTRFAHRADKPTCGLRFDVHDDLHALHRAGCERERP